ncbi:MAG: right-handed parallel beta-helix repeat-containing protein [Candidatus Eisenbacteria bacterium]
MIVAPGVYTENLVIGPPRNGVTLQSSGGTAATILDGNNTSSVITISSVGAGTVVTGFTIRNGGAANLSGMLGGGIRMNFCSARIEGNVISGNRAEAAGGVYVDGGGPILRDNTFQGNTAVGGSGGAIYCDHFAAATIDRNVIVSNTCAAYGGGITLWDGSYPTISNNTIALNSASRGGGIFVTRNSHPELRRNIIASSPTGGGVWVDDFESTILFACDDVWGNAPNYQGIADPTGGSGNISVDPQFCDPSGADLHLVTTSPCAPANSPATCDLIGALDPTCRPTASIPMTWGRLKSDYR